MMRHYHDTEWGVPEHDSRALWELLMLEGFQAGLSWSIILRKREAFRNAFKGFDPKKVARFTEADIERLMQDEGIVRARAKIEATINGAKLYLAMEKSGEDFAGYVWSFTKGKTIHDSWDQTGPIPCQDTARRGGLQRPEEARLQILRPSHRLLMAAGRRHR